MGIPLLFTDAGGSPTELVHQAREGLFPGNDTFPSSGIWPDQGISEGFGPQVGLAATGVVTEVDPTPAVALQTTVTLPAGDVVLSVVPDFALAYGVAPREVGQNVVYPVSPELAIAFGQAPATQGGMQLVIIPSVRELPPLRLHTLVETPSGRYFRWGPDERNPANVPSGERFSDTMPGGFENCDMTLPRRPDVDYSDLERLSTITVAGAGGEVAWQGRLERTPRVSGDQMSVSPSAVGWQAHLDDDKSATMIYRDIDLGRWGGLSVQRRLNLAGATPPYSVFDAGVDPDATTGEPSLKTVLNGNWGNRAVSLATYDAGRERIARVAYAWKIGPQVSAHNATPAFWNAWQWNVRGADTDTMTTNAEATANLKGLGPGSGVLGFVSPKRFLELGASYEAANTATANAGLEFPIYWTHLATYGDHELPIVGTEPDAGLLASDVVAHAVQRWAPQLNVSVGGTGSVRPSGFVINQLVFMEATSAAEIVRQTSRFGLQDWAVWDDRTFWWHDRGAVGRRWRARVGPAQLEETGPTADRLFESVIVQYQDVDGSTRTVGPPGSNADTESDALKDFDPDNPANELGIVRRALLQMGTSTPAGALEVGQRFLSEQKALDGSGRARFVGHVMDDRGVLWPYWAPRAGDTVEFVDASDRSARRVVRTDKDHGTRTCSVDLDAPPDGLSALLERLGVVLTDLGFN